MNSVKKAVIGCFLAFILTVFLLGGLELILRAVGYGQAIGFWREVRDPQGHWWIRENPWATVPFFSRELVRRPPAFRLPAKKSAESYRIFILGSSAAMGDPESSFSIARVLEMMLRTAYPKIHFEVVNAGITAINSHVVRGIAEDCAQLQPDLFVVYEGNNEVIGPFGPGTVFTPFLRTPFAIHSSVFLRGLRVGQFISESARGGQKGRPAEWGGMQMFLQHAVGPDDPRLITTNELFERNLRDIARSGTAAGATVILGTVLTNEKDFGPFESRHSSHFSVSQADSWKIVFAAGMQASNTGDWFEAERQWRQAVALDDEFAEAHFQLGKALEKEGDHVHAKPEFQRALDLDWLRFRTDSRLNETIRRVGQTAGSRVVLDDFVKTAESETPEKILGDEYLYEHVHLSFRGTYLVARDLFDRVNEDLVRRGRITLMTVNSTPISADEARSRLAFTIYDQAMIGKELLARFRAAPFVAQSTNPSRIAGYAQRDARTSELLALPQSAEFILRIYREAVAKSPEDWVLARNYGMALLALNQPKEAKAELLRALDTIPDDPDTLYALVLTLRKLGENTAAEQRASELSREAPHYPGLQAATAHPGGSAGK